MKNGIELIAAERERQLVIECWDADHDNAHSKGELIDASLSYMHAAINVGDKVRNLVKAGALIAAEIDRLQRLASSSPNKNDEP